MAINYVRFQRGTLEAYEALVAQNRIDENTLYFIYTNKEDTTGSLYMGTKLIVSGEGSPVFTTLDSLTDVNVANASANSFLVKNTEGEWQAKTLIEVATLIQDHLTLSNDINLKSDDLSVEILDNIIQLKNFGNAYYAFVPAIKDEFGNIVEESKYVLTEGFKTGLIPQVHETENGLELAWYEPNNEHLNSLEDSLNDLIDTIGLASSGDTPASGIFKSIEELAEHLSSKADINNVYSKEESDKAIAEAVAAADHLRRVIVNSIEDIDVTADDAHSYIYMVPTGLQYEDDKYDEYIVIENQVERVGSWEVDLSNYAHKNDIVIKNVSAEFDISDDESKTLSLKSIGADKINGLEEWLNNNAANIPGLSENNLTDDLYNKLVDSLFIVSVDTNELSVDNAGKLSILQVDYNKINGLTEVLNTKADNKTIDTLNTTINDIVSNLSLYVKKEDYDKDISEIKDILTWKDMN